MDGHDNPTSVSRPSGEIRQRSGDTSPPPAIGNVVVDDAPDLAAAQAGDQEAFGRLYDRHAPVVLSLCRRFSMPEAEDAAQETFIRAFRLLHKLRGPDQLRPWLYGIARRICSERRRAARRRARHEEEATVSAAASQTAATTPAQDVERAEQLRRLTDAIERLDDRERLAIHLYYLEADPVGAARSALGLSRSGYYKLLARARRQLSALVLEKQPS